jgi:hypothetical protein
MFLGGIIQRLDVEECKEKGSKVRKFDNSRVCGDVTPE